MAKAFDKWTVLPHQALQKHNASLWTVEGTMPSPGVRRVMTVARLRDGRLIIHNGVALEESAMKEIEAFGTPAAIVVPNSFHRQDAKVYKDRYPNAKVYAPSAAAKKVAQVVPVDGTLEDAPKDDTVQLTHIEGCKGREGVLEVKDGEDVTVVFNDMLMNVAPTPGIVGFLVGPTGMVAVPRFAKWFLISDKSAFRSHMKRLSDQPLRRIVVSHGDMISNAPGETLTRAVHAAIG